ncbi:hypothetical protein DCO57_22070 [Labrenzia sp. 011]|nr:hypothetical protein DCO57_22070 [Labrenzia sp. 011]
MVRQSLTGDVGYGAAWKLGGTTEVTQKIFQVSDLYFGALHESEMAVLPEIAPPFETFELKGEAEFAIRISSSAASYLDSAGELPSEVASDELFDAWCIALELPSSPILNLTDAGVVALLADRCAAGFLALGAARDFDETFSWTNKPLCIKADGQEVAEGGVENLLWDPVSCARKFLREARCQGYSLKPGQWISTGGATPCVPFQQGAHVKVYFDGQEEIAFSAGGGAGAD